MRVSDEEWRRQSVNSARKPIPTGSQHGQVQHDPASSHHRRPIPSPASRMPPQPQMMHSGSYTGQHGGHPPHHGNRPYPHPHHPHFMGHPPPHPHMMRGHPVPPMGYSPMGVPMAPGGYSGPPPPPHHRMAPNDGMSRGMYPPPPQQNRPTPLRKQPIKDPQSTQKPPVAPKLIDNPPVTIPKAPAPARHTIDPILSLKNNKIGDSELRDVFGDKQPKATALAILAFLGNEDLRRAGLVCKQWSMLATDKELRKFPGKDPVVR
jgi:hypothetical protein